MSVSYSVHHDMKIQYGGVVSTILGVTHCRSSKKNLNTKSSTEAELVVSCDYVIYNIWYVMFICHRGYMNKSKELFQDKKIAMRMEVNEMNYFT